MRQYDLSLGIAYSYTRQMTFILRMPDACMAKTSLSPIPTDSPAYRANYYSIYVL